MGPVRRRREVDLCVWRMSLVRREVVEDVVVVLGVLAVVVEESLGWEGSEYAVVSTGRVAGVAERWASCLARLGE